MPLSDKYISQAYEILAELARTRSQPICYSDLTTKIGISARAVGGVLQPISERSFREKRVLLSVLAVSKRFRLPSDVFFQQARRLGSMPNSMLPQAFFRAELVRVYKAYSVQGCAQAENVKLLKPSIPGEVSR